MSGTRTENRSIQGYEPPALRVLGTVHELTGCEKQFGSSDGHTMGGAPITCASSV